MIDTILKYTIVEACINMVFHKIFSVVDTLRHNIDIIQEGLEFIAIEVTERSCTWHGIQFTRVDTYYRGRINRVYDEYIEIISKRQMFTFRCSMDDFNTLYHQILKENRSIGRQVYSRSGYITIEHYSDDLDHIRVTDLAELSYHDGKKTMIRTFI